MTHRRLVTARRTQTGQKEKLLFQKSTCAKVRTGPQRQETVMKQETQRQRERERAKLGAKRQGTGGGGGGMCVSE